MGSSDDHVGTFNPSASRWAGTASFRSRSQGRDRQIPGPDTLTEPETCRNPSPRGSGGAAGAEPGDRIWGVKDQVKGYGAWPRHLGCCLALSFWSDTGSHRLVLKNESLRLSSI